VTGQFQDHEQDDESERYDSEKDADRSFAAAEDRDQGDQSAGRANR
jgi:hypothetical protein